MIAAIFDFLRQITDALISIPERMFQSLVELELTQITAFVRENVLGLALIVIFLAMIIYRSKPRI